MFTPHLYYDDRGLFLESFTQKTFFEATGQGFPLQQVNVSFSRRGTVRGIHFADVPPGQAKYIQCHQGAILDVVVDIRVGSPTFGTWEGVELDSDSRKALYIAEGLGHAFCVLSENATVGYMCSEQYAPKREHGVHPLDPDLGITWPRDLELHLSPKDAAAPSLSDALSQGLLPHFASCSQQYAAMGSRDLP